MSYSQRYYADSLYVNDVRDYLSTALKLLNPSRSDVLLSTQASTWLTAAKSESMSGISIFGRTKDVDFSQFKPRGHYTKSELLSNYFRAMMWLSRADLSLEIGRPPAQSADEHLVATRMKKAALVLWDCVVNSGTYAQWLSFNKVIDFMVGQSDGLSVRGMGGLVRDLGTVSVPALLADFNEARFDSVAQRNQYGIQMILPEARIYDNKEYDSLSLPLVFSFMPQRFVLDSYTFSQSVFPLVYYRDLPSSLDIAFVLGDNSALRDHSAALTEQGKQPTADQVAWLKQVVTASSRSVGCGTVKVLDGWYFDLVYELPGTDAGDEASYSTIADVHTKLTDEMGPAKVLHAASGRVNLMAVVVKLDTCTSVFVGPVGSYYDVVTVSDASPVRLTDEQWNAALDAHSALVSRPSG